ncbi:hypothetical protein EON77_12680, partial [bacterium]
MNATIDILRGELERLFTLEEMTGMSQRLLGLDPDEVGGRSAKASFAKALTERCVDGDRLEALVDVLVASSARASHALDPRVRELAVTRGREEAEAEAGKTFGPFTVQKKLGESPFATVYLARRTDASTEGAFDAAPEAYALKLIKRGAARDRGAIQRFLTANRLVATVTHDGLPKAVEAVGREKPLD